MTPTVHDPVVKAQSAKADKTPIKEVNLKPTEEQLREFVGEVEHLDFIDCIRVYGNRFRINCHTKYYQEGRVVPTLGLPKSWFIKYEDGEIVDCTIRAED